MKIPEPVRLKNGQYRIQLRLNGRSECVYASTATDCKREARFLKASYAAGKRQVRPSNATLGEILDDYIAVHRAVLSASTVLGYKNIRKKRFQNYMGLKYSDINWQKMLNEELADKSAKTVKNGWGAVRSALEYFKYPVPDVKLAKVPVKEIPFLQPEEILPFCAAVKGRPYEIPALLELHGLRLSEVRGLTWEDIDLKRELIHIRGAVVRGPDGDVRKETNKNRTSTRTVPIMIPQLLVALNAVEDKSGPVMRIGPQTLIRDVNRACERAGVTVVGNHGLRHSFASLVYHLGGVSERQLMEWGGWADYMTMHKIYIRLAASDKSKAQDIVRSFFTPEK